MDYETIPLTRLEASLRTTLDDCVTSGRPVVVELPGDRRVVLQPVATADGAGGDAEGVDDDLIDRLIAGNAKFRAMLQRSANSGTVPFDLTLEAE